MKFLLLLTALFTTLISNALSYDFQIIPVSSRQKVEFTLNDTTPFIVFQFENPENGGEKGDVVIDWLKGWDKHSVFIYNDPASITQEGDTFKNWAYNFEDQEEMLMSPKDSTYITGSIYILITYTKNQPFSFEMFNEKDIVYLKVNSVMKIDKFYSLNYIEYKFTRTEGNKLLTYFEALIEENAAFTIKIYDDKETEIFTEDFTTMIRSDFIPKNDTSKFYIMKILNSHNIGNTGRIITLANELEDVVTELATGNVINRNVIAMSDNYFYVNLNNYGYLEENTFTLKLGMNYRQVYSRVENIEPGKFLESMPEEVLDNQFGDNNSDRGDGYTVYFNKNINENENCYLLITIKYIPYNYETESLSIAVSKRIESLKFNEFDFKQTYTTSFFSTKGIKLVYSPDEISRALLYSSIPMRIFAGNLFDDNVRIQGGWYDSMVNLDIADFDSPNNPSNTFTILFFTDDEESKEFAFTYVKTEDTYKKQKIDFNTSISSWYSYQPLARMKKSDYIIYEAEVNKDYIFYIESLAGKVEARIKQADFANCSNIFDILPNSKDPASLLFTQYTLFKITPENNDDVMIIRIDCEKNCIYNLYVYNKEASEKGVTQSQPNLIYLSPNSTLEYSVSTLGVLQNELRLISNSDVEVNFSHSGGHEQVKLSKGNKEANNKLTASKVDISISSGNAEVLLYYIPAIWNENYPFRVHIGQKEFTNPKLFYIQIDKSSFGNKDYMIFKMESNQLFYTSYTIMKSKTETLLSNSPIPNKNYANSMGNFDKTFSIFLPNPFTIDNGNEVEEEYYFIEFRNNYKDTAYDVNVKMSYYLFDGSDVIEEFENYLMTFDTTNSRNYAIENELGKNEYLVIFATQCAVDYASTSVRTFDSNFQELDTWKLPGKRNHKVFLDGKKIKDEPYLYFLFTQEPEDPKMTNMNKNKTDSSPAQLLFSYTILPDTIDYSTFALNPDLTVTFKERTSTINLQWKAFSNLETMRYDVIIKEESLTTLDQMNDDCYLMNAQAFLQVTNMVNNTYSLDIDTTTLSSNKYYINVVARSSQLSNFIVYNAVYIYVDNSSWSSVATTVLLILFIISAVGNVVLICWLIFTCIKRKRQQKKRNMVLLDEETMINPI